MVWGQKERVKGGRRRRKGNGSSAGRSALDWRERITVLIVLIRPAVYANLSAAEV